VAFGANGSFDYQTFTNSTLCSNTVFSPDPDPGVVKACFYQITTATSTYSQQAAYGVQQMQNWYVQSSGLYDNPTGWWNAANSITVLVDYSRATSTTQYLSAVANTFANANNANGTTNFITGANDDDGWWALAWMDAYDLTNNPAYLTMAQTIFADLAGQWDTTTCGGGVWWNNSPAYKNAITNELFLQLAAGLANRTTNATEKAQYLAWAQKEWQWFKGSGMINSQNLINDGLNSTNPSACTNNGQTTWTYNQGVILGGLVELYRADQDSTLLPTAQAIASAAMANLVTASGVLHEPSMSGPDAPQFKGIFIRNLYKLSTAVSSPTYKAFVDTNANSVWQNDQGPNYEFGVYWEGPFDSGDATRQASALDLLNAAMEMQGPAGPAGYTYCAPENATCSFSGAAQVAFGANGDFDYGTFTSSAPCTLAAFGNVDPDYGVVKACFYQTTTTTPTGPAGYAYCAPENSTCSFSGTAQVAFGANGSFDYGTFTDTASCTLAAFGNADPDYGVVKACFYQITTAAPTPVGPAGYTYCAPENSTCFFSGTTQVAFGANGSFDYGTFTNSTLCSNSVFLPDPAVGIVKACFYIPPSEIPSVCDIYASGGTPCVAAHSTVRALFGSYGGRLYQVQRASDGSTIDIGTLPASSYANAAAQNSFCAGTTCIITIIYDQSSYHNDLAIAGPGGAAPHVDSGAVANALPITVNGNAVYGVNVTSGVGYRNNATSGVATGGSPEGMYMVASGTNVNNGCCFDYGNAESNSQDTGNGRMDAVNFGTTGPWAGADLENGIYGWSSSTTPQTSDFVTATLKNDGQTTFAVKSGNAQSGGLTTQYNGALPCCGYTPMSLEGGIVLGTGGDNSDWDVGSFFEGAMTSGYPTDAVENAVQANIVEAGYAGNSGGGNPDNGGSVYTGPSNMNGPQGGFASPATEQPNDIMATKPALASFNGSLYLAFQGVGVNNDLYVTLSSTGYNFPSATRYTNLVSSSAPALAVFNNQLFMAFRGLNVDNDFYVTSASDGSSFPTATRYTNIQMGGTPALAVFNNQLCAAFQANDTGHTLHVTCSSDGVTWPTAPQVPNVLIGSDPAMAVFNGKLYVAFRANDPSNDCWIASSSDGVNFSSQMLSGQSMGGNSAPALAVVNGVLYYIYGADDTSNEMLVTASTDGSTWQGPAAYLGVQMGAKGPGATAFGSGVYVGFQSNDSRDVLFITNN
jgi:predicted alpha-1,6-mannanase (GH76 family)